MNDSTAVLREQPTPASDKDATDLAERLMANPEFAAEFHRRLESIRTGQEKHMTLEEVFEQLDTGKIESGALQR